MVMLHALHSRLCVFAGQLSMNEDDLRSTAPYNAPTRLVSYIVTANVPALHLVLHRDLLYCRAEESDAVETMLYVCATSDICPCPCALCSPRVAE